MGFKGVLITWTCLHDASDVVTCKYTILLLLLYLLYVFVNYFNVFSNKMYKIQSFVRYVFSSILHCFRPRTDDNSLDGLHKTVTDDPGLA